MIALDETYLKQLSDVELRAIRGGNTEDEEDPTIHGGSRTEGEEDPTSQGGG